MGLTRNFSKISKENVQIAGGKGASLGEMINSGIPVPEGFVVLSDAFERFLEETDLNVEIDAALDKVNTEDISSVEFASEKIQAMILGKEMPEDIKKETLKEFKKLKCEFVAVRSSATAEDSATAAWAGQLDTYLNTTEKDLLENVKKCWASLFTPRAIFYRFEQKLDKTKVSVAVVVQKMVNSEESGIAFSVHPVTQDRNQLIIESGFGLGESIVSGQITPDSYVVDKQDWNILDININEQNKGLFRKEGGGNEWKDLKEKGKEQVLSEKEIIELSKMIVKIENHYGFPVDIEWAREKGKFYITQSRPITTLTSLEEEVKEKQYIFELEFTRETDISSYYVWLEGYLEACKILGLDLTLPEKTFAIYKNGLVKGYTQKENIVIMKEVINKLETNKIKNIVKNYVKDFEELEKDKKKLKEKNFLKKLVGGFVITFILGDLVEHPVQKDSLKAREKTEKLFYILSKEKIYKKENDDKKFSILTRNKIIPIINKKNIDDFLEKNNLLLVENLPVFEKMFTRDTSFIIQQAGGYAHVKGLKDLYGWKNLFPYVTAHYMNDGVIEVWKDKRGVNWIIDKIYEENKKNNFALPVLKKHEENLKKLKKYFDKKTSDSKEFVKVLDLIFETSVSLFIMYYTASNERTPKKLRDESLSVRDKDTFFDDCDNYIRQSLAQLYPEIKGYETTILHNEVNKIPEINILKKRKNNFLIIYDSYYEITDLEEFQKQHPEMHFKKEKIYQKKENELKGQIAYRGKVVGKIRVLKRKEQIPEMQEGEIIVSPMTTPDFLPAMKKAAAFITDEGGLLCHAAIVSRELKKPCIIGTKFATQIIKDGDLVEVDAEKGIVRILEKVK